ncbi:MAG: CBS domain-containing protein [Planctomycetes bacterium]|nr:CBS domain-containing protein [Planctomycetota bacterium]
MITAREIMREDVVTINLESSLEEAIELMLLQEISGLPVTDNEGHLVGIVTEFALLAIVYDDKIRQESVSQHMTTEVLTIDVDDPIRKIADMCIVHRVRRAPVMHNGRIVGLIARRDVLKALYEAKAPACTA